MRQAYPDILLGLKDSSGDLDYSASLAARLSGFAVFPSAEGSLGRARELGFAGCISATANVTGPWARAGWLGDAEALAKAIDLRARIAAFPLVASVKATLGLLRSDEEMWNRLLPPLSRLSETQRHQLRASLSEVGLF